MQTMTGKRTQEWTIPRIAQERPQAPIEVRGCVHNVRRMANFAFVILRRREGTMQCVAGEELNLADLAEGNFVEVTGEPAYDARAPHGFELRLTAVRVLGHPAEALELPIHKYKLDLTLEKDLEMRPLTLRALRKRALFKVQEGIVRGFRDFLHSQEFTEIHTPKIVRAGAEGGANIFKLDYFGRRAYLAQSPQFYKQTMVGVYDRVFEVGPVFRAEKHATTRHLNEYTSLDFEMGYIDSFVDVMEMETAMLQSVMDLLRREYAQELEMLQIELPDVKQIPAIPFREAKEQAAERYGRRIRDPYDLEPEEEQLISRLAKEEKGSDFVFVTHYPSRKRPFYAMDDPEDAHYTLSFDLLFRGMEVTTGGQRIHDYAQQVAKMQRLGMDVEEFTDYLRAHKNGLPPHGGLGIGLERLTMKLAGENNIRKASLFPRDIHRITP
ncbi:MAG: aspartate--tRNA(Asn) ligase [Candidatus Spyradocola sp.]|jgi:nondiscriminating aspartyl-tRNA synthetase